MNADQKADLDKICRHQDFYRDIDSSCNSIETKLKKGKTIAELGWDFESLADDMQMLEPQERKTFKAYAKRYYHKVSRIMKWT